VSAVTDIADAVAFELNGGSFSQAFEARRAYQPTFDLKDMKDLHVTVVPKSVTTAMASRADDQVDCAIDIGIQKKLGQEADADADALMALVEEISAFLNRRQLAAAPDVIWVSTANEPIFSPEHFEQLRQFTSVLTVTYRVLE